jgi:hypothetical protein
MLALRAGAMVLTLAACILVWNELANGWKSRYVDLLDVPVQLSGVSNHRLFTKLSMPYDVAIRFRANGDDPRVLCAIGYLPAGYSAHDKDRCANRPAVLSTRWLIRDGQRIVAEGQTPGEGSEFSLDDGFIDVNLGHFASHAGRPEDLRVTFRRDARSLSFTRPRLVVHGYWLAVQGELGAVWVGLAIVLTGIGLCLVLIGGIRGAVRRLRRSR